MYIFLGVTRNKTYAEAVIECDENTFFVEVIGAYFMFTWRACNLKSS